MKNKLIYFGLLLCLAIFTGCKDEFGKTLFGPEDTVAPEKETDRTLVFLNTTDAESIQNGTAVTADPVDVIFSAAQPIGQIKEIKTSAKLSDGKSRRDQVFTVSVVQDETLLQQYKEANGYRVKFLPEEAYSVATNLINLEYDGTAAVSQSIVKIINSSKLDLDQDYLLALQLQTAEGFIIEEANRMLYLHVKRKGGSGEAQGAADLRPMTGDNTLDPDGVDLGINRNNLYYETEGYAFQNLAACTIEGLIYVDSFKASSERGDATLAGISSVWGYEAGSDQPFLIRFGDAGIEPNKLQVNAGGKTLLGIRQSRIYQHKILIRRRFVSLYPDCHARKIIIQLLKPRKHVLFFQYLMNAHRVLCSHVHLLPQPGCKTFQFNITSQAHCTSEYNF